MTALADFPVAQAWSGGGPQCGPRRGPVRGGPGPCEDHAVLAAAGPRGSRRGRGMVRLGRHRAEDRLRRGPPPAGHLVLAPPGHSRHPAGRGRVLRGLRAACLAGHRAAISDRTRRFARWSAICSFALGMAGQVTFHLMDQDHVTRAPWGITTLVSCLPVLVLGMGTTLAHMLREDAERRTIRTAGPADRPTRGPRNGPPSTSPADHPDRHRDQDQPDRDQPDKSRTSRPGPGSRSGPVRLRGPVTPRSRRARQHRPVPPGASFPVPRTKAAFRHP